MALESIRSIQDRQCYFIDRGIAMRALGGLDRTRLWHTYCLMSWHVTCKGQWRNINRKPGDYGGLGVLPNLLTSFYHFYNGPLDIISLFFFIKQSS